ncbi:MAG: hydrogenase expression/synthesis, HypA [Pyrinomonas sp.]
MHELSLALSIVDLAAEEANRRGVKVHAVRLRLGPLSGVVKEALLFSYALACEGTPLDGSRLVIEEVPVVVHCSRCRADREPISMQNLRCSVCGEPSFQLVQGSEMEVVALEVE